MYHYHLTAENIILIQRIIYMYMYDINYMVHHQTRGYYIVLIYIPYTGTVIYSLLYHHINDTLKTDAVKRA